MTFYCGLDFGTSNSTIGVATQLSHHLIPLEKGKPIIPSAIFCDTENKQWIFGQEGINCYLEGFPGRLMRALKSVLGSSLMNEKTIIFNENIPYTEVLKQFILHLKTTAEKSIDQELTQVMIGRPVHFHDHDIDQDRKAQLTLTSIAQSVGFRDIGFQYEPIAAALIYEMSIKKEELALIIDIGGGTSDFTVIRLSPGKRSASRSHDVLANAGIHIAGTDFDQQLSLKAIMPLLGMGSLIQGSSCALEMPAMLYHELTTWHTLNNQYTPSHIKHVQSILTMAHDKKALSRLIQILKNRTGHRLLDVVETTKKKLSEIEEVILDLNFIESNLAQRILRVYFETLIEDNLKKIIDTVKSTIDQAGIKFLDINAIFYTGGSTKIPLVRDSINKLFPHSKVVLGDAFGSVGLGLTLEARRQYG